ncbi:Hsp20/alpha crystallin family protein [Bacillus sp. BRMEA1]|uniref:Hsp20/alpha crystallin family protein n=1 Tax=Neobacillus endophyticus TaxID=2738405 RepID=UPI001564059E|nr:Hsp20/alpha crystallin family protein [Neobacillus endophyticus]NRD80438.1 Hsp20/alpha crystallin family protein [Neobacillus endophyticus]
MDMEKFKKWMDDAQQYQSDAFWNKIFDSSKKNSAPITPLSISEYIPKCDVYELDHHLIVEAEMPGLTKDHIHISIQQQLLIITGEFNTLKQNRKYFLKERANRKFKKEVTLPYPIIHRQIKSEIRNGILIIILPINREEVEDIPISFE